MKKLKLKKSVTKNLRASQLRGAAGGGGATAKMGCYGGNGNTVSCRYGG